jgi:hypothetical protein
MRTSLILSASLLLPLAAVACSPTTAAVGIAANAVVGAAEAIAATPVQGPAQALPPSTQPDSVVDTDIATIVTHDGQKTVYMKQASYQQQPPF